MVNVKRGICAIICAAMVAAPVNVHAIPSFGMVENISDPACAASVSDFNTQLAAFPASYRSYIKKLHAAHPNWVFQAWNTGLDWNTVCANENYPTRNLVEKNSISSWKSASSGNYNEKTGWVIKSDPDWVQASDAVVRAYLDPRNFLTEMGIFQFEIQTFNSNCHTLEGIKSILKGTFMENAKVKSQMTYAQAFLEIGRKLNVSPYLLASRVRQEQGVAGSSAQISGKVPGYTGYYNFFNIQASGVTRDEITLNAMREAKNEGWNTKYKALLGGSKKVANNYIFQGQDTFYLQKFDVDSRAFGMYWHQYMQNLLAAESESANVKRTYDSLGITNKAFVFKIPVYKNMPSAAFAKPASEVSTVSSVKAAAALGGITVTYSPAPWASGYRIFRSTSKNGNYTQIAYVTGTSYTDKAVSAGTTYYYKVRMCLNVDGGLVPGGASQAAQAKAGTVTKPSTPSISVKGNTIKWNALPGVTGYRIYRATKKNGSYAVLTTIKPASVISFKDKSQKSGEKYYYKIRAFKKINGSKVWSAYSTVQSN